MQASECSKSGLKSKQLLIGTCHVRHAVIGLTRTCSEDYAGKGLRINAVCPGALDAVLPTQTFADRTQHDAGYMDTPMTRQNVEIAKALEVRSRDWTPMGRPGQPGEVADAVIFLSGGRSSFITGSASKPMQTCQI